MKLPVIKKLVETCSIDDLQKAEYDLLEGNPLSIEVEGGDEGEKLTHVLGALDILVRVKEENKDPKLALREFFERVRNSIS